MDRLWERRRPALVREIVDDLHGDRPLNDALGTSPDRRTALAHFVLQMSPHDAALLQQALDLTRPRREPGDEP
jgi:hypothetical protein